MNESCTSIKLLNLILPINQVNSSVIDNASFKDSTSIKISCVYLNQIASRITLGLMSENVYQLKLFYPNRLLSVSFQIDPNAISPNNAFTFSDVFGLIKVENISYIRGVELIISFVVTLTESRPPNFYAGDAYIFTLVEDNTKIIVVFRPKSNLQINT